MRFYKFIKTRGEGAKTIGFFVPRLYRYDFHWRELKLFGFQFVKERLSGWTIWYVTSEEDYILAVESLHELKRTHLFEFKVTE